MTAIGFGLVGTILLAVALSKWMRAISVSLNALETFKDTFINGGDIINPTGADKHRSDAAKNAATMTYLGLLFIIVSSVCQILVVYFSGMANP